MSNSVSVRINCFIWKLIIKIPFVKVFLLILNSYVWMGDPRAFLQFAPAWLYFKRFAFKLIFILVLSFIFIKYGLQLHFVKTEPLNTLDMALQLFPNILGFGIGAYALLFTFPERFFKALETGVTNKKLRVGAQGLNAITAFPLLVIAFIILGAAICKILLISQATADSLGLFFVLYGMVLTIELIAVLFVSARKVIRNVPTKSWFE